MEIVKNSKTDSSGDDEKRNIDLDIINHLKKFDDGDKKNAVLYIRGDVDKQNAVLMIKGDVMLLANTLIHHIDNNPEFGRFILAVIGSYLAKNPQKEKEFQEGMVLLKHQLGIN